MRGSGGVTSNFGDKLMSPLRAEVRCAQAFVEHRGRSSSVHPFEFPGSQYPTDLFHRSSPRLLPEMGASSTAVRAWIVLL